MVRRTSIARLLVGSLFAISDAFGTVSGTGLGTGPTSVGIGPTSVGTDPTSVHNTAKSKHDSYHWAPYTNTTTSSTHYATLSGTRDATSRGTDGTAPIILSTGNTALTIPPTSSSQILSSSTPGFWIPGISTNSIGFPIPLTRATKTFVPLAGITEGSSETFIPFVTAVVTKVSNTPVTIPCLTGGFFESLECIHPSSTSSSSSPQESVDILLLRSQLDELFPKIRQWTRKGRNKRYEEDWIGPIISRIKSIRSVLSNVLRGIKLPKAPSRPKSCASSILDVLACIGSDIITLSEDVVNSEEDENLIDKINTGIIPDLESLVKNLKPEPSDSHSTNTDTSKTTSSSSCTKSSTVEHESVFCFSTTTSVGTAYKTTKTCSTTTSRITGCDVTSAATTTTESCSATAVPSCEVVCPSGQSVSCSTVACSTITACWTDGVTATAKAPEPVACPGTYEPYYWQGASIEGDLITSLAHLYADAHLIPRAPAGFATMMSNVQPTNEPSSTAEHMVDGTSVGNVIASLLGDPSLATETARTTTGLVNNSLLPTLTTTQCATSSCLDGTWVLSYLGPGTPCPTTTVSTGCIKTTTYSTKITTSSTKSAVTTSISPLVCGTTTPNSGVDPSTSDMGVSVCFAHDVILSFCSIENSGKPPSDGRIQPYTSVYEFHFESNPPNQALDGLYVSLQNAVDLPNDCTPPTSRGDTISDGVDETCVSKLMSIINDCESSSLHVDWRA